MADLEMDYLDGDAVFGDTDVFGDELYSGIFHDSMTSECTIDYNYEGFSSPLNIAKEKRNYRINCLGSIGGESIEPDNSELLLLLNFIDPLSRQIFSEKRAHIEIMLSEHDSERWSTFENNMIYISPRIIEELKRSTPEIWNSQDSTFKQIRYQCLASLFFFGKKNYM